MSSPETATATPTKSSKISFIVPEHEHVQDKSILAVLSNARSAAKSARGPLLSTAPYENSQANIQKFMTNAAINSNNNNSSNVNMLEKNDVATINNNNLPGAPLSPFVQRQMQQERDKKLLSSAHDVLNQSSERRFLTPTNQNRSGRENGNNNNINNPNGTRPLTAIHRSLKQAKERQTLLKQQEISTDDAQWFDFVDNISQREMDAADNAANMHIDDLDEHGQLGSDFLSGLDEETWDFETDLFTNNDLTTGTNKTQHNYYDDNNHNNISLDQTFTNSVNGSGSGVGGFSMSLLATPELRKKHAEKTTFWTLRRIIEKLQHRVKSVTQQRDAYKGLLGRYSNVASELHHAAKRCDAATTILSDRYRRVVASEMANRKIEPPFPPGTVIFGNAQSQQGKEIKPENSMAAFGYPVDGFGGFEVSPQMVDPDSLRSIVTGRFQPPPPPPTGSTAVVGFHAHNSPNTSSLSFHQQQGLGVPARGVDWQIVGEMEKDAANIISTTHENELKTLQDQLSAAFRRHSRDVKTVATMRRGVADSLDHCRYLERVILEKDNDIARLYSDIKVRDDAIEKERQKAAALKKEIDDLMKIRFELDEELGKAGDNEHDLAEMLKELKNMIAVSTQRAEKEAAQRKEENSKLRSTMQEFSKELDGTVGIWKNQWREIKIAAEMNKKRVNRQAAKEQRKRSIVASRKSSHVSFGEEDNNHDDHRDADSLTSGSDSDEDEEASETAKLRKALQARNNSQTATATTSSSTTETGFSSEFMKQVLDATNKQKLDFATQWVVLNEVFEQKRIDLSSRCTYEQVQTWNFIFKAILDMFQFTKQVQTALKERDDLLQQQYSTFEEQLRPLLTELRQLDDAAKRASGEFDDDAEDGKNNKNSMGFGSALLRFQNRLTSNATAITTTSSTNALGRRGSSVSLAQAVHDEDEERRRKIKPALEVRKDVSAGVDRIKSLVAKYDSDGMSHVTRAFALTFSEMFLKSDQVWNQEYLKMKENYETTTKKFNESQLAFAAQSTTVEDLKRTIEELKTVIEEKESEIAKHSKMKRGAGGGFGAGGGGGGAASNASKRNATAMAASGAFDPVATKNNGNEHLILLPEDEWWAEGSPQLASALDGIEARMDSLKSALLSTQNNNNNSNQKGSTKQNNQGENFAPACVGISPQDLSKMRSELVEDLDHFERVVHQVLRDESFAQFPEGFVPTACLAKIVKFFCRDTRWLNNSLQHQATASIRHLAKETNYLLSELKRTRSSICTSVPNPALLEQGGMTESLLFLRAKNVQFTKGLVGNPLRRLFFGFSRISHALENVMKTLQYQQQQPTLSSVSSTGIQQQLQLNHNKSGMSMLEASMMMGSSGMFSNGVSQNATGMPLVCTSDVHSLLHTLQTALQTCVEEFQITLVAGSLGQWSTLHRALLYSSLTPTGPPAQIITPNLAASIKFSHAAIVASEKQQQQQTALQNLLNNPTASTISEQHLKLGVHSKVILEKAIENALDLSLGPLDPTQQLQMIAALTSPTDDDGNHDSSSVGNMDSSSSSPSPKKNSNNNNNTRSEMKNMMEGTIAFRPSANKVASVEEAMIECKMDTATARLILHRFEEMVLCRGGMSAPFLVNGGNNNNNSSSQQQQQQQNNIDTASSSPQRNNQQNNNNLNSTSSASSFFNKLKSTPTNSTAPSIAVSGQQQNQQVVPPLVKVVDENITPQKRNMFQHGAPNINNNKTPSTNIVETKILTPEQTATLTSSSPSKNQQKGIHSNQKNDSDVSPPKKLKKTTSGGLKRTSSAKSIERTKSSNSLLGERKKSFSSPTVSSNAAASVAANNKKNTTSPSKKSSPTPTIIDKKKSDGDKKNLDENLVPSGFAPSKNQEPKTRQQEEEPLHKQNDQNKNQTAAANVAPKVTIAINSTNDEAVASPQKSPTFTPAKSKSVAETTKITDPPVVVLSATQEFTSALNAFDQTGKSNETAKTETKTVNLNSILTIQKDENQDNNNKENKDADDELSNRAMDASAWYEKSVILTAVNIEGVPHVDEEEEGAGADSEDDSNNSLTSLNSTTSTRPEMTNKNEKETPSQNKKAEETETRKPILVETGTQWEDEDDVTGVAAEQEKRKTPDNNDDDDDDDVVENKNNNSHASSRNETFENRTSINNTSHSARTNFWLSAGPVHLAGSMSSSPPKSPRVSSSLATTTNTSPRAVGLAKINRKRTKNISEDDDNNKNNVSTTSGAPSTPNDDQKKHQKQTHEDDATVPFHIAVLQNQIRQLQTEKDFYQQQVAELKQNQPSILATKKYLKMLANSGRNNNNNGNPPSANQSSNSSPQSASLTTPRMIVTLNENNNNHNISNREIPALDGEVHESPVRSQQQQQTPTINSPTIIHQNIPSQNNNSSNNKNNNNPFILTNNSGRIHGKLHQDENADEDGDANSSTSSFAPETPIAVRATSPTGNQRLHAHHTLSDSAAVPDHPGIVIVTSPQTKIVHQQQQQQRSISIQVNMDPIDKASISDGSCQTNQLSLRQQQQFSLALMQDTELAPKSSAYSILSNAGTSRLGATDHHVWPALSHQNHNNTSDAGGIIQWAPAKWVPSETVIQMPPENEIYHHHHQKDQNDNNNSLSKLYSLSLATSPSRGNSFVVTHQNQNTNNNYNDKSNVLGHTGPSHPVHRERPPTPTRAQDWKKNNSPVRCTQPPTTPQEQYDQLQSMKPTARNRNSNNNQDNPNNTLREWKIKGGGGSIFLLRLERGGAVTSSSANNNNTIPNFYHQRPQSPGSVNVFGSPIQPSSDHAVSNLSKTPSKQQQQNNKNSILQTPRSVFDVSQQLAAELEKIEQSEKRNNNNNNENFTFSPVTNLREETDQQQKQQKQNEEMSLVKKKILEQRHKMNQEAGLEQIAADAEQRDRFITTRPQNVLGLNTTTYMTPDQQRGVGIPQVMVARQKQNSKNDDDDENDENEIDDDEVDDQNIYHDDNQINGPQNGNKKIAKTITTAIESSFDPEFCRMVGLTPQGAIRHSTSAISLNNNNNSDGSQQPISLLSNLKRRRPQSANNSSFFVSKTVEKALQERIQREAKKEINSNPLQREVRLQNEKKEFLQKTATIGGSDNNTLNHLQNLQQEQDVRVVGNYVSNTNLPRRRELGNLSGLASALCGTGSMLARKLQPTAAAATTTTPANPK